MAHCGGRRKRNDYQAGVGTNEIWHPAIYGDGLLVGIQGVLASVLYHLLGHAVGDEMKHLLSIMMLALVIYMAWLVTVMARQRACPSETPVGLRVYTI